MQEMTHRQGIRNTNAVDEYVVMNDAGIGGDQRWSANSNDVFEENMLSEHSATKITHVVTYVPAKKDFIKHIPHDVCARLRIGHFKHACVVRQHQKRRYFRHRVVHATQLLHSLAHCGRTMVPHTDVQVFTITATARQTLQCQNTDV